MSGLRFLGLLAENRPTPDLESIARSDAEARKEVLYACLVKYYGIDLVENLATMTPKMFSDAISERGTTSATQRKAERFFIEVARFVGIGIPDTIAKRSRGTPRPTVRKASQTDNSAKLLRGKGKPGQNGANTDPKTDANRRVVRLRSGGTITLIPDVDWLHLSTTDREFAFNMIDQMGLYEGHNEEAQ